MTSWQRRAWTGGVAAFASALILLGVLVGLFRIAVQVAPGYRQNLADWVGQLIGSPVAIASMDLAWRGWYPTLLLGEVVIGAGSGDFMQLDEMQLGFPLHRILIADPVPARVVLIGPEITLVRSEAGLRLEGVGGTVGGSGTPGLANRLLKIGEVFIRGATLVWDDRLNQLPLKFLRDVELRARKHALGFEVELVGLSIDSGRVRGRARFPTLELPPQRLTLELDSWFPWEELNRWFEGLPQLRADLQRLELDAYWRGDEFVAATGRLALRNAAHVGAEGAGIRQLSTRFRAERRGPALQLALDELQLESEFGAWPATALRVDYQPVGESGLRLDFDAGYLRLDDLEYWAPLLPEALAEQVRALAPSGELHELIGHWDSTQPLPVFSARLHNLGWAPAEAWPGVAGLSGRVRHEGKGGRAQIDSSRLALSWPRMFAQTWPAAAARANVDWHRDGQGWQVSTPVLILEAPQFNVSGALNLRLGEAAAIDLALDVASADPQPLLAYQPLFWSAELRDWLSRAVRTARVPVGRVVVRGALGGFPWPEGDGEFLVDLAVRGLDLDYAPDWPPLRKADLQLVISGRDLDIAIEGGELHGARIDGGVARKMLDKRQPLRVEADVSGDAKAMFGVLAESPLRRRFSELISSVALSGPASMRASLELPLWDLEASKFRATGRLDGVRLSTPHWPEPVRNIRGEIRIRETGLQGRALTADMERQRFIVDLQPDEGRTRITARTELSLSEHGPDWGLPAFLARGAEGLSRMDVAMVFGDETAQPIVVRSDLVGTALAFPAPFGKDAETARALELRIDPAPDGGRWLHSRYGELLDARMLFAAADAGPSRMHIRAGGEVAPEPLAPGLWVDGKVTQMSFSEWYEFLSGLDGGGEDMRFGGLVVSAADVDAFGQRMRDLRLQLTADTERWTLSLAGADAQGTVRWARSAGDARGKVEGRFGRLHWGWDPAVESEAAIDPGVFPALDLAVDNLILNDQPLGRLQLTLAPVADGIAVERVLVGEESAPQLDLRGDWLRDARGSRGRFDFALDTRRFANWLAALDYEENIRATRARVKGHLEWPPDPRGLTVDAVSGEISVNLADGQILAVEPGAGRMLGLLSFNALPRRVFLDFRDVVDSGLGFDRIRGNFQIADGDAYTEGLVVEGPSLKVESRGRVGLAARDYDQTITIFPSVSSGVTLAATVLGGPAVGLFTLFAQELFGKPLDQATQFSYHLGGSWENPEVSRTP